MVGVGKTTITGMEGVTRYIDVAGLDTELGMDKDHSLGEDTHYWTSH